MAAVAGLGLAFKRKYIHSSHLFSHVGFGSVWNHDVMSLLFYHGMYWVS